VSVKPAVKNVFDMTGFTKFLHIECSEWYLLSFIDGIRYF
jgi:hypothetical protein